MKKTFDQTMREIKREVNKTVLKVPRIEQKVLDATSNEPWGPYGSLLADIALSTRDYHEQQRVMAIIWKRINDTGKNWRHVYKALTVLEYLVANGSERVIEEIKERAYQISTLSDFQYIDSSGRDQGNNVRRKSQNLVALLNDKERIIEIREKAAANRDKFRSISFSSAMYRPRAHRSGGGYGDRYNDRPKGWHGSKEEDSDGSSYGREREYGYGDYDFYGRNMDSYCRAGDQFGVDYEERNSRDSHRVTDYQGRSQSFGGYQCGSRSQSQSSKRERKYAFDDDGQNSTRSLERKPSEQNICNPPSHEQATSESGIPYNSQRAREASASNSPKSLPPNATDAFSEPAAAPGASDSPSNPEFEASREFDPRASVSVAPTTSSNAVMDLLGSLSESFHSSSLAIVPAALAASSEPDSLTGAEVKSTLIATSSAPDQTFEDPFGDSPFRAIPSPEDVQHPNQCLRQEASTSCQNYDVLAGILPFSGSPRAVISVPSYFVPCGHHQMEAMAPVAPNVLHQAPRGQYGQLTRGTSFTQGFPATNLSVTRWPPGPNSQLSSNSFVSRQGESGAPIHSNVASQPAAGPFAPLTSGNFRSPHNSAALVASQCAYQAPGVQANHNSGLPGNFPLGAGPNSPMASEQARSPSVGSLSSVSQPSKCTFEPKSTVWADTLSRGLVDLNISGPRTNPLADIGIDFEAINRKEKRLQKPSAAPATSPVTMGKPMGFGSGIGRAGAMPMSPSPNNMVGSGVGMGMGVGMSGYGSMSQHMSMGMGMNMNMNRGMGQGGQMQQPGRVFSGSVCYTPQHQYHGGGYR